MPTYKTENPGKRHTYKTKPTKLNEQINSFDAFQVNASFKPVLLMAKGLSEDDKKSITQAIEAYKTDSDNQSMYDVFKAPQYNVTTMANSQKSWIPLVDPYNKNEAKFRDACKKLADGLDAALKDQNDDEKNPFTVYYADYFRGLSENRSYMAQFGNDSLLENTAEVINSNINFKFDNNGFTYEQMHDAMSDVPLPEMLSQANAMHRIISDESSRGDSHPTKELEDRAKVIRLCKAFKESFQKLQAYDETKFNQFNKDNYIQNPKALFMQRGLTEANSLADDRLSAVEHGWLVRDLPLISRCRFMSDKLTEKIEQDHNMDPERVKEIQEFNRYFTEEVLKNKQPMNEERRAELIKGIKTRFEKIQLPEIATAKNIKSRGQEVNSDTIESARIEASRAFDMLNQIEATENRKLANYEKDTLRVAGKDFDSMIQHFDDLFANMPSKPSMFLRVSGDFEQLEEAYRHFKRAVKDSDDPVNDEEVRKKANDLFEATKAYNKAKDEQKSISTKASLEERRSENQSKRSAYGQYRYNLSDELNTCAHFMMKLNDKKELRESVYQGQEPAVKKTNMSNLLDKFNMNNSINSINDPDIAPENHYEVNFAGNRIKANKKSKSNGFIKI